MFKLSNEFCLLESYYIVFVLKLHFVDSWELGVFRFLWGCSEYNHLLGEKIRGIEISDYLQFLNTCDAARYRENFLLSLRTI